MIGIVASFLECPNLRQLEVVARSLKDGEVIEEIANLCCRM